MPVRSSSPDFAPLIADWFSQRYDAPTPIQEAAWPRILAGEHLLITAPTGSGKTLTAFLAAIHELTSGAWPSGQISVLYVSPLKALNNDIQRNLMTPLTELRELADERGMVFPDVSVATRSGDTPNDQRRAMLHRPPEILITTPESLNIILASPRARAILSTVKTVILDEIHAVAGTKRGTHLMTAVEQLVLLAGEFQRVAVSATVKPLEVVARFVGGREVSGAGVDASYRWREVGIVTVPDTKRIELVVDFPEAGDTIWPALVRELRAIIDRNRSTLIFVTTRRHAEKLTLLINEGEPAPLAYAHHGSLSRELRHSVEQALKAGELRAIVATNSLELGIDIGSLDEVVMVKTPTTVSSTLQRLGRAGHRVGQTSRGTIFPLYGRDMVDAAAMSEATLERDIEEVRPVRAPLDVLAQVIVSMTAMERWKIDDLYAALRASWSYHSLERRPFDLVIEMLAGRYAETRIRELRPRVSVDRVSGEIVAREGMTALLYRSGGTIPDRGYYAMRLEGGGAIGELDEEFVWERRTGETFVFGSQAWTIASITDREVIVNPASPGAQAIPFWRAETRGRDAHYARRLLDFLEACERALVREGLATFLDGYPQLTRRVRDGIEGVLEAQRRATGTPLPHRHHIVVERVVGGQRAAADDQTREIIVHCGWGGRVNEPFAVVLAALWEHEYGYPLEVFADNDALVLLLPVDCDPAQAFGPARFRELARSGAVEARLRERLERSGRFGALFRENAGRALLLPKGGFSRRMPLWLNRIRSKKLLAATSTLPDFPILLETWRSCLSDAFDLEALHELIEELASGEIAVSVCETLSPSPFAAELVWQQINLHMYQDDSLPGAGRSSLSDDLMREAVLSDSLRPMIRAEIVEDVESRLTRRAPGYAPSGASELLDWVTERVAIPEPELRDLGRAVSGDHGPDAWTIEGLEDRFIWVATERSWFFAARNRLPSLAALYPHARVHDPPQRAWDKPPTALSGGTDPGAPTGGVRPADLAEDLGTGSPAPPAPEDVLAEMLRFTGPTPLANGHRRFGLAADVWTGLVSILQQEDLVVVGRLTEGAEHDEVCETEALEYLLRVRRAVDRPVFETVSPTALVALWAQTTMLGSERGDPDALVDLLDTLFGYGAPAGSWEANIIPARLDEYYPLWLDGLFAETELIWLGAGEQRVTFGLAGNTDLFQRRPDGGTAGATSTDPVVELLRRNGRMDFFAVCDEMGQESSVVASRLWGAAWEGAVSNDSYQTLRQGIRTRFNATSVVRRDTGAQRWSSRRRSAREWSATRPVGGRWFAVDSPDADDPIAVDERERERARVLLGRYGVVFRELVQREGEPFVWRRIFRALRLMELAGEVVSGLYVSGIGSPQFALRSALESLASAPTAGRVVWMSAVDPASPCGLGLGEVYEDLPPRVATNHLVFRGTDLVMTSRRQGRELSIRVAPDDSDFAELLAPLRNLVGRRWNPLPRVAVETVNGEPVRESAFAPALKRAGFRDEYRTFVLSARYQ